ncbi:Glycosyltransferase [Tenacibaculum litopenaei]|uniref:glycosyltransferase family 4 protein n=1 Tax=Tenacibaculum litopenaei TaxID=396016 RepID=UPI003893B2D6
MKKHVVVIGYVWVSPKASAAGSRMLQLIAFFLRNEYTVTFATPAQKNKEAFDLQSLGVKEASIELNHESFDDFIKREAPTVVLFDRYMMEEQFGWRVAEACPEALRILDTEDLHCLRLARQQAVKKGSPFAVESLLESDMAKRELAAIYRSDVSLIISSYEMTLLTSLFKVPKSLLYHLPFMYPKMPENTGNSDFESRKNFVFVGNFLHAPNVDAVLQLRSLWKLIRKQLPEAELHIYGAYPTQQIQECHKPTMGLFVKGYVEDAEIPVKEARVVLAPIRFGAGIKGKLTEAMRMLTPSVTTKIGAEGMHDGLPWNGVVVDSELDFVTAAVDLYRNREAWEQAREHGIQLINKHYEQELLSARLLAQIEQRLDNLSQDRRANFIGSMLQYKTLQATKYMSKWITEKNRN